MNINVPVWAEAEFWDEPPPGAHEFWGFRFPPPCKVGDPLVFRMRGVVVARAVCCGIEPPGKTSCDHSGRFSTTYNVFWRPESFVEDAQGRALLANAGGGRK